MGKGQELLRSKVAESLVRANGVVDTLPGTELTVEDGELERIGGDLIKLFGVGALSALDMAIEFGRAGWQDEQMETTLLAGLLELGGGLPSRPSGRRHRGP